MNDERRRALARQLRSELTDVVPDAEQQAEVAAELDDALGGSDPDAVLDAMTSTSETRAWFGARAPVDPDTPRVFQGLPGDPSPGVYYFCSEGDSDKILSAAPEEPPRCPNHGTLMITES